MLHFILIHQSQWETTPLHVGSMADASFKYGEGTLSHIMSCGFVFYVRCLKIFYLPNFYLHIVFFIYWHSFLPVGLRDLVFFSILLLGREEYSTTPLSWRSLLDIISDP